MINNSPASYAFIRACIFFLHYIAPLSAVYCMAILLLRPSTYRVPLVLEIWAIAETAFFALIYVPRTIVLQRAATHPELLPREQRRELFKLCLDTVEDPEKYLSGWMRGAPASEIKRENVKGESQILRPSLQYSKIQNSSAGLFSTRRIMVRKMTTSWRNTRTRQSYVWEEDWSQGGETQSRCG